MSTDFPPPSQFSPTRPAFDGRVRHLKKQTSSGHGQKCAPSPVSIQKRVNLKLQSPIRSQSSSGYIKVSSNHEITATVLA